MCSPAHFTTIPRSPQQLAFLHALPFCRTPPRHPHLTFPRRPLTHTTVQTHPPCLSPVIPSASAAPRRMPYIIRPMVPSPTLLQFVEDKVQPRPTVIRAVGDYIRENNLQDPNDRRRVICDDKLRNLLGVDTCTMLEVSKYITPHLLAPETVGGRYLDDAKKIEDDYVREKERLGVPIRTKTKKQTQRKKKDRYPHQLVQPFKLSPQLAAICRTESLSRPQIVAAIWEYIRMNNLKGGPGTMIRCDFLMRQVYNTDEISVQTVMKGIEAHLEKPQ